MICNSVFNSGLDRGADRDSISARMPNNSHLAVPGQYFVNQGR